MQNNLHLFGSHPHSIGMETTQTAPSDEVEDNNASREASPQNLVSSPPLIHFMKYVVPSVLALVTVKYQAKPESLFRENPVPLWCFIAAICVYWLSVGAMEQITNINGKWFKIASRAAVASGVLSAFSLLSMFLTYPVSLVPLLIWIPILVILAWPLLYHAYSLVNRGIASIINKTQVMVDRARGLNSTGEASLSA